MADVGQDVAEHARHVAGADRLGRAHVVAHRVLDELGAHQPVDAGPAGEAEDQHDRADAAPEHRREREDQQDARDRGEDVVDPLEEVADLAAEEAGERAEQRCRSASRGGPRETPTRIEICAPLIALASTSRPSRSPPKGSVVGLDALGGLVLLRRLVPFLVARRERVDGGDVDVRARSAPATATLSVGARRADEGRRRVRARRARPASRARPGRAPPAATSSRNSATTTSETMPTRSLRKRRAAARQTPSERRRRRARAGIGAVRCTALISAPPADRPACRARRSARLTTIVITAM